MAVQSTSQPYIGTAAPGRQTHPKSRFISSFCHLLLLPLLLLLLLLRLLFSLSLSFLLGFLLTQHTAAAAEVGTNYYNG